MKTSYSKWIIAVLGFCAILESAHAADQVQAITINVPVEIDWPQSDVDQAFIKGPPFLRCEIHALKAPANPTGSDNLALGFDKALSSASQPLMVDASGHFSGKVSLSFSVPAAKAQNSSLSYWCYLASQDSRAAYLDAAAQKRGLKVEVDQGSTWQNIKK